MPYRALTHGRVRGSQKAPTNAHTNQVKAIQSQKGLGNSGPIRKNNSTNRQKTVRTLSRNFLMAPNAYGNGRFSPGQGKGFPEATPLPSVGSVNRFARRAIARRAVTKRIGVSGSKNCCPDNKAEIATIVPNLSFTIKQFNDAQPVFTGPADWPNPASGELRITALLSNVIGAYFNFLPSFIPNNNWGLSYIDYKNSQFGFDNEHILQFYLGLWPSEVVFNPAKFYKLSVSVNGANFSIELYGSVLNDFSNTSVNPNQNVILIELKKDPAYTAGNLSNSAASPNHIFQISSYNPWGGGYQSPPFNLLSSPSFGNQFKNADWSGFSNKDFPQSMPDINTDKITVSLTEI